MRVVCVDAANKFEILRNSKCLRDSDEFKGIYINPDQTQLQRMEAYNLRQELKQRRAAGEDVLIRRGEIVKKENF